MKYGSYPHNADFNDLPIENKQRLFIKQTIDCLTDDKIERLKVSSIELSLDNRRYKSHNRNANFY